MSEDVGSKEFGNNGIGSSEASDKDGGILEFYLDCSTVSSNSWLVSVPYHGVYLGVEIG
jgi:hypothetical protein